MIIMGLRRWLATRFPKWPVHQVASVATDEAGIRFARVNGVRESVRWDEVDRVLIRTTDKGPFDDDVFFVVETALDSLVIPQPAKGCDALLCELQQLPGFDNQAVIEAMGCTDNREFLCWERGRARG
jgi:hypothetical protein